MALQLINKSDSDTHVSLLINRTGTLSAGVVEPHLDAANAAMGETREACIPKQL
jgi:hypothetical protein